MKVEEIILNEKRNVNLVAYIQNKNEINGPEIRPAIVVIPGGGYYICADCEAEPVALAYLKAGFQAFILNYSVSNHGKNPGNEAWPNPLEDYEAAMELIKSKKEEWSIDPEKIAVIGFSAGGHLAGVAATIAKNKPKAAVLGYPVAGEHVKKYNNAPDVSKSVDENTCPCFVFATRDDPSVPVKNSLQLLNALESNNVQFEAHIYSHGPHGYSTCDNSLKISEHCPRLPHWVEDSIEWLRETLDVFN